MNWLLQSDIMIAEVTNPSLGVVYEIGRAIENNKKIICLFRENKNHKLSAMIRGANQLVCINYSNFDDLIIEETGKNITVDTSHDIDMSNVR